MNPHQKTRISFSSILVLLFTAIVFFSCNESGSITTPPVASPGILQPNSIIDSNYVLVAPQNSDTVFLLTKSGSVYNYWTDSNPAHRGLNAYLLPNGQLLHTQNLRGGGSGDPGGRIVMTSWNNDPIWSCTINSDTLHQSHDVYPLPNGNVLADVWEWIPMSKAIEKGRTVCTGDSGFWCGMIMELEPRGDTAVSVWEWHLWDHLVTDSEQVAANPWKLNINYMGTPNQGPQDWIHMNALAYNPALNQIVISSRNLNEIYVIELTDSSSIAARDYGGKCGRGGDFIYRWGNPAAYNMGGAANPQQFFGQHSPYWPDTTSTTNSQLLINNDGFFNTYSNCQINQRPPIATTFNFLSAPYNPATGNYGMTANTVCSPALPSWTATAPGTIYWNEFEGNAQLLPDSTLLVCAAQKGILYIMNPTTSQVTWQFNMYGNQGGAFRCYQYTAEYVAQAMSAAALAGNKKQ